MIVEVSSDRGYVAAYHKWNIMAKNKAQVFQTETFAFSGLECVPVEVQVVLSPGLPQFNIVGLPDKTVAESRERIRAAFQSIGLGMPCKKIIASLSPANIKKEGSHYDLPIAVCLLVALGVITQDQAADYIFMGEVSLDGTLRAVPGILAAAIYASNMNKGIVCSYKQGGQVAWCNETTDIIAANGLVSIINHFNGKEILPRPSRNLDTDTKNSQNLDMSDIKGQMSARRAAEIAAIGSHSLALIGPPGSGKSMLAARINNILPPLTTKESLEVSMIYSMQINTEGTNGLIIKRPFRAPHHTATSVALSGGGTFTKPGELSLAHHGVLFLDELPEFGPSVLEVLRQPIETGEITISRANHHVTYPARFQLVVAMNPCKCGYAGIAERECNKVPECSRKYLSRISGPLIDRIHMTIQMPQVKYNELLNSDQGESSATIRKRVLEAIKFKNYRLKKLDLSPNHYHTSATELENEASRVICNLEEIARLTARGVRNLILVARTIADMDFSLSIKKKHITEAAFYLSSTWLNYTQKYDLIR